MAGIRADELDVILSRIKLAQLLGRGEGHEGPIKHKQHNLTFRYRSRVENRSYEPLETGTYPIKTCQNACGLCLFASFLRVILCPVHPSSYPSRYMSWAQEAWVGVCHLAAWLWWTTPCTMQWFRTQWFRTCGWPMFLVDQGLQFYVITQIICIPFISYPIRVIRDIHCKLNSYHECWYRSNGLV